MRRKEHIGLGSTQPAPRLQVNAELLALLANRLTQRDRWLLEMLHTHRVFTLPQIADLAFGSPDTARHRLLTLYRLGAVSRFRPARDVGSAPHHYVLGPAGTAVLSAAKGEHIGYRHEYVVALAHSAKLAHSVGANQIFCTFYAHARRTDGCALERWWSECRCEQAWGRLVRPDGYGRWRDGNHAVDFFLEYDTGTEPLNRLVAKVDNYARLAEQTGITDTLLLFVLPSQARERHLHALLRRRSGVPIATTFLPDVAGRVWLPVGGAGRETLGEVPR